MQRTFLVAIVLAALAGAGSYWAVGQAGAEAIVLPHNDAAEVARGKALYQAHCASCHGADLAGEPDWRSRDAEGYLPAPPHDATSHTWHHPDAVLFEITKYGTEAVVGGGYQSRMMGFGTILSDEEILATLGYIKSTWPRRIVEMHDEMNAASR